MSNKAVQKYYARLLYRGSYTMDKVPEEDREKVQEYLNEMIKEKGPYIPDPETETPVVDNIK